LLEEKQFLVGWTVVSPIKLILLRKISIFSIWCWEIFWHVNFRKVGGRSPHFIFGEMEATNIREKEKLNWEWGVGQPKKGNSNPLGKSH